MIHASLRFVDLMRTTPVEGAAIRLILRVCPRWREIREGKPKLELLIPGKGEEFVFERTTDPDGRCAADFDVDEAFERQGRPDPERDNLLPFDVIGVMRVEVRSGSLHHGVTFSGGLMTKSSRFALKRDAVFEETVALDFAKTIVGHTTSNSVKLWFNLHGEIGPERRHVCELRSLPAVTPEPLRSIPVPFVAAPARAGTATLTVDGLLPGHRYGFTLVERLASAPEASGQILAMGEFATVPVESDRVAFAFGSCHDPILDSHLERWDALAARTDYDLLLLIGDQIYGDDIEKSWSILSWFDRYVRRYHQVWSSWPMREVMRRTPTYMVLDDHEVVDDWGTDPEIPAERITAALQAYRLFQQAHNPGGENGPVHYSFRRGPAAFFVSDSRTARSPEGGVLGAAQRHDLRAWANSPRTREADVIVFVAPVPIAFLPVQELQRLIADIKEEIEEREARGWGIKFAEFFGSIGLLIGGPFGFGLGAAIGGAAGVAFGAIGASEAVHGKLDEAGLGDLRGRDLADQWSHAPNQEDMKFVLDCLYDLALDRGRPAGAPQRRRAVIVLGGDVHSGSMHLINSRRIEDKANPVLFQVTSSAISRQPATDRTYENVVRHIRPGLDITEEDLFRAQDDFGKLVENVLNGDAAHFPLDDENYEAKFVDLVAERNFGRIQIQRVDSSSRKYQFSLEVAGQSRTIRQFFELNLDAAEVKPYKPLVALEGKPVFLRVHNVGGRFGPRNDDLDAEVIVKLDSAPKRAFGFTLREDSREPAHRAMLDLLRTAFNDERRIRIEFRQTGEWNGQILRVAITS